MSDLQGCFGKAKQEENVQGKYGEHQQERLKTSWICPNCETITTGATCSLCGYQKKEEDQRKRCPGWMLVGVTVVLSLMAGIIFMSMNADDRKYNRAYEYLTQEQYAEALNILAQIPDYGKTPDLINEVYYQKGLAFFKEDKYADAYSALSRIPASYKETEAEIHNLKLAWGRYIIDNALAGQAADFSNTVSLTEEESGYFYEYLVNKKYDSWDYEGLNVGADFRTRSYILLSLTDNYPKKSSLITLFNEFNPKEADDFIWENRDIFLDLWDTPVAQSIISHDENLAVWMLGRWVGSDFIVDQSEAFFLRFYYQNADVIGCDYRLVWDKSIESTSKYKIVNQELILLDSNNDEQEKMFRFRLYGPDNVEVYCYRDGLTYAMTRLE